MWCFRLPLQHLTCTWSYMTMKDVIYYMYVKTSGAHVGDEWVRSSSLPGSCLKMSCSLLGIHQLSWISHPISLFFGCSLWIVDYHGINMWEQKLICWYKLSLLFMELSTLVSKDFVGTNEPWNRTTSRALPEEQLKVTGLLRNRHSWQLHR